MVGEKRIKRHFVGRFITGIKPGSLVRIVLNEGLFFSDPGTGNLEISEKEENSVGRTLYARYDGFGSRSNEDPVMKYLKLTAINTGKSCQVDQESIIEISILGMVRRYR